MGVPGVAGRLAVAVVGCGPIGGVPGETIPPAELPATVGLAPEVLTSVVVGLPVPPVAEGAPNVGGDEAPTVVLVSVPTGATVPVPAAAALAVAGEVTEDTGAETPVGSAVLMRFGLVVDTPLAEPAVDVAPPGLAAVAPVAPGVAVWAETDMSHVPVHRPARIKACFVFMAVRVGG